MINHAGTSQVLCRAKFTMNYEYIESVLRERRWKRERDGWLKEKEGEGEVLGSYHSSDYFRPKKKKKKKSKPKSFCSHYIPSEIRIPAQKCKIFIPDSAINFLKNFAGVMAIPWIYRRV